MRIVAGSARGRPIKGPRDDSIRPTADRVRESIFNILGQWLDGARVLDLFAGTGALALEALSRGAVEAVLVDSDREAVALCRENAQALGFAAQCRLLAMPVRRGLELLAKEEARFDLIFADPPYAAEEGTELVVLEGAQRVLAPGGTVVLEHDKHRAVPEAAGALKRADERAFGATRVSFFRSL